MLALSVERPRPEPLQFDSFSDRPLPDCQTLFSTLTKRTRGWLSATTKSGTAAVDEGSAPKQAGQAEAAREVAADHPDVVMVAANRRRCRRRADLRRH